MTTTNAGRRSRIAKLVGGAAIAAALSTTLVGQADAAPTAGRTVAAHAAPQIGGLQKPETFWWGWGECGGHKTWGLFNWVFSWWGGWKNECQTPTPTPIASLGNYSVTINGTSITINGGASLIGTKITLKDPNGGILCTTLASSAAIPGVTFAYPFGCTGLLSLPAGTYSLTLVAEKPGSTTQTYTISITIAAPASVSVGGVTPNPTSGPVTISGSTNRPGATVTVTNGDGSTLCTTTANSSGGWSCSGTIPGADGAKTLTVKVTSPSGTATTSTTVTKTTTPVSSPLAISALTATPNPTSGPVTVSGKTNRSGATIKVTNADGSTLCTTTGSTTAAGGLYSFSCSGTVPGADGAKTLTVKATGPNGNSVTQTVTVTKTTTPVSSSLAITGATASPNPTTGPITVSGKTNRPGAVIKVTNADGSLLCSTTGSSTAVGGLYSFSCAGTLSGATGSKTLTVKATGPNGNTVSVTVSATLTAGT